MSFVLTPLAEPGARVILSWRYDGPYTIYNPDDEREAEFLSELLNGTHYAVRDDDGLLSGFFAFGLSAQVPGGDALGLYDSSALDIGLGMAPAMTGKGLGLAFVLAGMAFARRTLDAGALRLSVAAFNVRAIRVYERAGFHIAYRFPSRTASAGEQEFLLMRTGDV